MANLTVEQNPDEILCLFNLRPIGGGTWAVCEQREVLGMIDDEGYEIRRTHMTRKEYEALEDFDGW